MNWKLYLSVYLVFCASIIYWDIHRYDDNAQLSKCHNAEVKEVDDKYLCLRCNKYCEVR